MSKVAIVHPTSLLGKELREALEEAGSFASEVALLSNEDDEIGILTRVGDAAALIQRSHPSELADVEFAFFCDSVEKSGELLDTLPASATAVLLSPDAGSEHGRVVIGGVNAAAATRGETLVSPHPAVILIAHLLHPLLDTGLEEAVASLVQPASVFGEAALDELYEQARGLISMNPIQPALYLKHQLAFNLLPAEVEAGRAAAQSAEALGGKVAVSAQIVQGGIFHGLSVSLFVRCPGASTGDLRDALAASPYLDLDRDAVNLGPVDAAGRREVLVGEIATDPARPGGFWIWAVMDNLTRGGALNAIEIAEAAR